MRLRFDGVVKTFAGKTVLAGVSADFGEARAVVLIGPSGGGKSTLLRILAGLEMLDSGAVRMGGVDVDFSSEERLREHRLRLGVVFQAFNLFPHLTALQNITLPLVKVHGRSADEAGEIAMQTLLRFRLGEHAGKKPAELSGGQKQRVAIARALAVQPKVLLFDEPTSALDPEMTAEVLEVIEELKAEGRSFVLVTHAMNFARRVGDAVGFLADGRLIECGSAQQVFGAPESGQCRDFLARVLRY